MKNLKLALLLTLSILALNFATLSIAAASSTSSESTIANISTGDACNGLTQIDTSQDCSQNGNGVTNILRATVNILSIVAGIAAVIMIIVSGLRFITSGGDSAKVSSAKNALVYALIGLAIAALAQVLVHFVIHNADTAAHQCKYNSALADNDPGCKPPN